MEIEVEQQKQLKIPAKGNLRYFDGDNVEMRSQFVLLSKRNSSFKQRGELLMNIRVNSKNVCSMKATQNIYCQTADQNTSNKRL